MNTMNKMYDLMKLLIKREINYMFVRPTNALFFITYRCSSRCNTCTMWQRKVTDKELSLDEWKALVDRIAGYGIKNIEMFGGDALLRKNVVIPLIKYIKQRQISKVDLTTNCNLMDEETALALIETGIDVIYVSIDGVGETHDRVRGVPGSFERTKKGLQYLIKAKGSAKSPEIIANCTISSLNIHEFEKVLPFSRDIGADVVAFEYAGEFPCESLEKSHIGALKPEPYYVPQKNSLLLNKEDSKLLKQKIRLLRKEHKKGIRVITRNIDFLNIDNLTQGVFPNKKCYVCRYLITIDPYGNVIPCPFFNNYYLGNVREKSFSSIWNNKKHYIFMKHIDEKKVSLCRHCILGVERNPTFAQALRKSYLIYKKKGADE